MRAPQIVALVVVLGAGGEAQAVQAEYFEIRVVDGGGAPVPCVELTTTGGIALRTDAGGRAAFYEPGLMGTSVWFSVAGPHVQRPPDPFGYQGLQLTPTAGGSGEIVVESLGPPPCVPDDLETQRIARGVPSPDEFFRVDIVDDETDRGLPLVVIELPVRDGWVTRWVSDSGGHVAIDPLGLDDAPVSARVWSHGHAFADDGAITLPVAAGGLVEIPASRLLPAERLYRVTGGGIHRDAVLLDLPVPLAEPTINGLVIGQDSVFTAMHRDQLRWIWGDTTRAAYPLGNFHAAGATSLPPGRGGLDPELGVDLTYFVDQAGFSRAMAPPETVPGEGVTWLAGLVSVPDESGEPRLHATFAKVLSDFSTTRAGMLTYDEATDRFEFGADFDLTAPEHSRPHENAFLVDHGDARWVYYHVPVRIPASSEALLDPARYETFTPYLDVAASSVDRDDDGRARYRWRQGGIPYAVEDAALAPEDTLDGPLVDVLGARPFVAHRNGSTEWNDHTQRFVRLITPRWALGETWIALSDTPMGPWVYTTQLVTHDAYTFYNPRHHRSFDGEFGRRIHFEATYTNTFSGNPDRTPRYDYNQVMYAVDLDRPQLQLPVPIYLSARGELGPAAVIEPGDAPIAAEFFAPLLPGVATLPVWWSGPSCEPRTLEVGGSPATPPLFWALPPDAPPSEMLVALGADGDSPSVDVGEDDVIAMVWRNPIRTPLPVADHLPPLRADAGVDRCLDAAVALQLPPRDDTPAGGSAHWELDGAPVEDGALPSEGLHVLTRVLVRADGYEVRDDAIVRVGEAPAEGGGGTDPDTTADGGGAEGTGSGGSDAGIDGGDGCGCVTSGATGVAPWLVLVPWLRRRRRRS